LPERFRRNAPLNEPDRSTFYAPGAKGYIGYPTLAAQAHRSPPAGAPRVAARLEHFQEKCEAVFRLECVKKQTL